MLNYLIPNEIISSTKVYDQDANHSRRFTLAEFGGSLNFIAICFIQYFLFVDIWTFTWNCFRIFKKQRLDERTETWWYDRDLMRRLKLDETTETDERTETWWNDWDFRRQLGLDETTETWWNDWDLLRRLRLLDETNETWWDDWNL